MRVLAVPSGGWHGGWSIDQHGRCCLHDVLVRMNVEHHRLPARESVRACVMASFHPFVGCQVVKLALNYGHPNDVLGEL